MVERLKLRLKLELRKISKYKKNDFLHKAGAWSGIQVKRRDQTIIDRNQYRKYTPGAWLYQAYKRSTRKRRRTNTSKARNDKEKKKTKPDWPLPFLPSRGLFFSDTKPTTHSRRQQPTNPLSSVTSSHYQFAVRSLPNIITESTATGVLPRYNIWSKTNPVKKLILRTYE